MRPLTTPRRLVGGDGNDRLVFDGLGQSVTFDGCLAVPTSPDATLRVYYTLEDDGAGGTRR